MKKIIHTADWHLGAKLHEEDRLEEQKKFLGWLAGLLVRERPDALIVAGDIFDTYAPSNAAEEVYYDFLGKVFGEKLAGHVVIVGGNHDSPSQLDSPKAALTHLRTTIVAECRGKPEDEVVLVSCADGGRLAIGAVPFLREADLRNAAYDANVPADAPEKEKLRTGFAAHYAAVARAARALAPEAPLVLTGHGMIRGAAVSDDFSERGRTVIGGLDAIGADVLPAADYIALGHLHIAQKVDDRENIRYAGSPIPMSFSEAGTAKSVAVCEFDGGQARIRTEEVPCFQPLQRIKGSCSEIEAAITQLLSVAGPEIWVETVVTKGEGEQADFNSRMDRLVKETRVKILACHNARLFAPGSELPAEEETVDLRSITPEELARGFFTEKKLTDGEIHEYLAMLKLAEADANENHQD